MKKIFFILIILIFAFFSCSKKKDPKHNSSSNKIISSKEMTSIIVDAILAESAIGIIDSKGKTPGYYTWRYYNFILIKHNTTIEQYRKSFDYYVSNSEKMLKIMTSVVDSLSEKQSKIRN